jgi:hypothetical protein
MSKGSKQPTATSQTVTQSNIPEYARPFFENLLNATQSEISQPYQPYSGARVQGFTPDQSASFSGIRNLNMLGNPTTDTAAQGAYNYANQAGGFANYAPQMVGTQTFPGTDMSQYMNPYITNVLDVLQNRTNQQYGEQMGQRNTAAQRAGAFGGSRQGVENALAARNLNTQLGEQQGQLLNQGYNTATGLWQGDVGRQLQAAMANQQAGIQGAGIGIQGLQTGLQGQQLLGQLGAQQQGLAMDRLKALQAMGQQQQALGQQGLDTGYQDFINQRDYGRNNLSFMSGILRGLNVQPESNVIQYQQQPNAMSSAIGSGISALGLAKTLGS